MGQFWLLPSHIWSTLWRKYVDFKLLRSDKLEVPEDRSHWFNRSLHVSSRTRKPSKLPTFHFLVHTISSPFQKNFNAPPISEKPFFSFYTRRYLPRYYSLHYFNPMLTRWEKVPTSTLDFYWDKGIPYV